MLFSRLGRSCQSDQMIRVGDPVLIVVRGPHGAGLVKATVEHVYESPGIAVTYDSYSVSQSFYTIDLR